MPFFFDNDTDTLSPPRPARTTLALTGGDGEANASDDVHALDDSMRHADPGYRPKDYPAPQRYIHGPLVDGVRDFQKRQNLPDTGRVRPGDDTERAINNRLLAKPPGAGLLHAPYAPIRGEGAKDARTTPSMWSTSSAGWPRSATAPSTRVTRRTIGSKTSSSPRSAISSERTA